MSLKSNSTCGLPGVCLGEIRIVLTVLGSMGPLCAGAAFTCEFARQGMAQQD